MSATLFKVRAASLLSARSPDWCAGFLSGLLIGSEIGAQRDWIGAGEVAIVGDAGLAGLYAKGLAAIGGKARIVDGARSDPRRPENRAATALLEEREARP